MSFMLAIPPCRNFCFYLDNCAGAIFSLRHTWLAPTRSATRTSSAIFSADLYVRFFFSDSKFSWFIVDLFCHGFPPSRTGTTFEVSATYVATRTLSPSPEVRERPYGTMTVTFWSPMNGAPRRGPPCKYLLSARNSDRRYFLAPSAQLTPPKMFHFAIQRVD